MKLQFGDTWRRFVLLSLTIASAAVISCSAGESTAPPAAASQSAAIAPPARSMRGHWMGDQRLRTLMAELKNRNPAWPSGLPQEPESPAAATQPYEFDEIAGLANQLADAADHIPGVTEHMKMSEADRAGFLAEARTLHEQAVGLQAAANRRSIEQMQRQMDGINATCLSCHSRYRDFAGNSFQPQAAASSLFRLD